jgi:hypothetical protein
MTDLVVAELKTLEKIVQSHIQSSKSMEGSLERLRNIEQLLERVAIASEASAKALNDMLTLYIQATQKTIT